MTICTAAKETWMQYFNYGSLHAADKLIHCGPLMEKERKAGNK